MSRFGSYDTSEHQHVNLFYDQHERLDDLNHTDGFFPTCGPPRAARSGIGCLCLPWENRGQWTRTTKEAVGQRTVVSRTDVNARAKTSNMQNARRLQIPSAPHLSPDRSRLG